MPKKSSKNSSVRISRSGAVTQTAPFPDVPYSVADLPWERAPANLYPSDSIAESLSSIDPDWTTENYRSFVDPTPSSRDRSSLADVVLSWTVPRRLRRVLRAYPSGTPRGPVKNRSTARLVSPWGLLIRAPERVAFCIRRKMRRRVMFAFRFAGLNRRRSPGRGGSYRRTQSSSWRC